MRHFQAIKLITIIAQSSLFVLGCKSQPPAPGTIDEAVAKAKANGRTSIVMEPSLPHQAAIPNYDDEMNKACLLHVRAEAATSAPNQNREAVITWYKFKVLSDMSHHRIPPRMNDIIVAKQIPKILLPLSPDEIVLQDGGGTISVDGINVSYGDTKQIYVQGKDYLLICHQSVEAPGEVSLPAGREMAYRIADDGDTLEPLGKPRNTVIQEEVQRRFHNSLTLLSTHAGATQ